MKAELNPHGNGKGPNAGKFLGKNLKWWRDNTQDVLDPSVLLFAAAFDPDAKAKKWIAKLKQICEAKMWERNLRLGGNVGWVEVVQSGAGAAAVKVPPAPTDARGLG